MHVPCLWNLRYCFMPFNNFFKRWFWNFPNELNSYYQHASTDGIRAVILCPTRELAAQTTRECKKLAKGKKFRIKLMTKQLVGKADLSKLPCDILISTPLRLRLAIRKKKINLSRCVMLISCLCLPIHAFRWFGKKNPLTSLM